MHRIWLIPAWVLACTNAPADPPAPPVVEVDLGALNQAIEAHRADPGPSTLSRVSKAAGAVAETPVGDKSTDRVIGDALCNVLLRPDLGRERLDAHAQTWTASDADPWLDCLVRAGDVPALAAGVSRLHGRRLDPNVDGLKAAVVQARSHPEITWKRVLWAHDAGALADAQHPRGRPLDRPMPDLVESFRVFQALYPDHRVHAVVTRSARNERDDPLEDPGVIPVVGGRRRVFGYATGAAELQALAERVVAEPPVRLVGVAIEAVDDAGASKLRLCAEGRMEGEDLWLLTACHPTRELAWVQATEHVLDAQRGGATPEEARASAARLFSERIHAP